MNKMTQIAASVYIPIIAFTLSNLCKKGGESKQDGGGEERGKGEV